MSDFRHGGAAAVKAITKGAPMGGLAAQELQAVKAAYDLEGSASLIELDALRFQTAANLYWNAIQKAAETQDLKALDGYIKVFAWLNSATLRAMDQLTKLERDNQKGKVNTIDVLQAIKAAQNDNSE